MIGISEAGQDVLDRRVAQEEEERGEEHDDGEAHALGGGLVGGLGLGQLVGAKRRRLGRQRGADLGALGAGQGNAGGQLGQLDDPKFLAKPTEGGPRGLPSQAGLVERPAQRGEGPTRTDAGRVAECGLDAAASSQGDDDQVEERAEGVAEIATASGGVGSDAEVGQDETGQHAGKRRPQRDDEGEPGAAEEQQRGDGRGQAAGRPAPG